MTRLAQEAQAAAFAKESFDEGVYGAEGAAGRVVVNLRFLASEPALAEGALILVLLTRVVALIVTAGRFAGVVLDGPADEGAAQRAADEGVEACFGPAAPGACLGGFTFLGHRWLLRRGLLV